MLNIKENPWFQGKSFEESDPYVISEAYGDKKIFSVRDEEWKYIESEKKKELYYLPNDTFEQNNLISNSKYKETVLHFHKIVKNHISSNEVERKARNTLLHKNKVKKVARQLKHI